MRTESDRLNANGSVGIFITNTGLAFALIYSFVFGRSYSRFDTMSETFAQEVACLQQLVLWMQTIGFTNDTSHTILCILKEYAEQIRYEVKSGTMLHEEEDTEIVPKLFSVMPPLRYIIQSSNVSNSEALLDNTMAEMIVSTISEMAKLRYKRWDLRQKVLSSVCLC